MNLFLKNKGIKTMTKDDYFVIVYKLLMILYTSLKHGKAITEEELNSLSSTISK